MQGLLGPKVAGMMALTSIMGIALVYCLARFYRGSLLETSERGDKNLECLDISLQAMGGFSWWRLAVASALGLFLELLLIRWVSSEIRIFAYFKNFVLIACFLGFGLGCRFCRRRINLAAMVVPLVALAILIKLPWSALHEMWISLPTIVGAGSEVNIWGVPNVPMDWGQAAVLVSGLCVVAPLFALIAFVFVPIGQIVGWYLENAKNGPKAYTLNVLASIFGIGLYTGLCFAYEPPWVWFFGAGLLLMALLWLQPRLISISAAAFAVCMLFSCFGPGAPSRVYWSPYQKLTLTPSFSDGELTSYELNTNDSWYQHIVNLSPAFVAAHPAMFGDIPPERNAYNLPYRFQPHPKSVLVLGAGAGNDVAAALRNGAQDVVAVEIDPLILKLGRELHFEHPYSSPHVELVTDDARSYLQNTHRKFDLVVFSLLDSHTTSSYFTNIRIDNYVYTEEAFAAAHKLLAPDGIFVVKFLVTVPWIAGRLNALMIHTFGEYPLRVSSHWVYRTAGGTSSEFSQVAQLYLSGSHDRILRALADPDFHHFVQQNGAVSGVVATLTTDDWPYFYQHEPGLPVNVILMSVMVVLIWWGLQLAMMGKAGGQSGNSKGRRHPGKAKVQEGGRFRARILHFFFLGAAFMLLEAQIVSRLALLFGTTWLVNSIAITGLLLLVVAGNLVYMRWNSFPVSVAYSGVFVSIVIGYFFPLDKLFVGSVALRAALAMILLCLPVFFAAIIFIRSFSQADFSGEVLGYNLFGSLAGGLLESLSFWTGLKALLIVAALLYAASALVLKRQHGSLPCPMSRERQVAARPPA
jgi:SAM-dependent methyltransferase